MVTDTQPSSDTPPSIPPVVHMVGNAHLDPAWMWSWGEGMEAFLATCRAALERMEETPEFIFTCSSAAHYRWVEEVEPELFTKIQQRVAEGRWAIVGGWWVQADCNLPSAEGFVRQAVLGQHYFFQKFGKIARVGYSPDAFGHVLGLPQLLARSGMVGYIFCRPDPTELSLPSPFIRWHSPDGSCLLGYRVPFHYNMYESSVPKKVTDLMEAFNAASSLSNPPTALRDFGNTWCLFYGVGNHGGGPTKEHIHQIIQIAKDAQMPDLLFSNPEHFFDSVTANWQAGNSSIPNWHDDLQLNAPGCYTAHSEIKKMNRQSEHLLMQAELLSSLATLLQGAEYPVAELRSAWENVCFNHFHDILCGVAIREALEEATEMYGQALHTARKATRYAIQRIARTINTNGDGQAVFIFNRHSWQLQEPVTVELWHDIDKSLWSQQIQVCVRDTEGNDLPCQLGFTSGKIGKDRIAITFPSDVPAFGWRLYRLFYGQPSPDAATGSVVTEQEDVIQIENPYLRISISARNGCLTELYHKQSKIHFVEGAAACGVVISDRSDTWGHGVTAFDDVIGIFNDAEVSIVENGPTHVTVRSLTRFGASWLQQDIQLFHHAPQVSVSVKLFWAEQYRMLKLSFPTTFTNPTSLAETAGVVTRKPADGTERPCGIWFAACGTVGTTDATLGIATDAKHGFSLTPDGDLRMSVVRSPAYALHIPHPFHPDEDLDFLDQGIQRFQYILRPIVGANASEQLAKAGAVLNAPLLPHLESAHGGTKDWTKQGIEIGAANVVATVLKRSEKNDGWVVRLHETAGIATETTVHLLVAHISWKAKLYPYQLSTWLLRNGEATEVNLIEL